MAHRSGLANRQIHSRTCSLEQLPKVFLCGKQLRFPVPGQILWDFRFLATAAAAGTRDRRAPEPSLLRAMQLDLRIREPIVERNDDTAIQDTDTATTEALAVLNEKQPIRNAASSV